MPISTATRARTSSWYGTMANGSGWRWYAADADGGRYPGPGAAVLDGRRNCSSLPSSVCAVWPAKGVCVSVMKSSGRTEAREKRLLEASW